MLSGEADRRPTKPPGFLVCNAAPILLTPGVGRPSRYRASVCAPAAARAVRRYPAAGNGGDLARGEAHDIRVGGVSGAKTQAGDEAVGVLERAGEFGRGILGME